MSTSTSLARSSILIIDDSRSARNICRRLLNTHKENVYSVMEADSPAKGLDLYRARQPDCTLLDCKLAHTVKPDLLQQLKMSQPRPPRAVILLTDPEQDPTPAPTATWEAQDCLVKSRITAEALHRVIQRSIREVAMLHTIEEQRRRLEQLSVASNGLPASGIGELESVPRNGQHLPIAVDELATAECSTPAVACPLREDGSCKNGWILCWNSNGMSQFMKQIEKVAGQDTTILLTGETGTGKTCLARQIHQLSPRRAEPFMVVNCGVLSANVIESEMFGHVRGSFTGAYQDRVGKFAAVGKGTLVLDEIDALPIDLQAKLLRAVDEFYFEPVGSNVTSRLEARLIAISNRVLTEEVAAGRFREDLFYRLSVVEFNLPPLRQRREAIAVLARNFLRASQSHNGRGICGIADEAFAILSAYSWPGNIRQLRNVIERAAALCSGQQILPEDLPNILLSPAGTDAQQTPEPIVPCPTAIAEEVSEQTELDRILAALKRNNNNRQRAASDLGVCRMTLYNRLHYYGLYEPRGKRKSQTV